MRKFIFFVVEVFIIDMVTLGYGYNCKSDEIKYNKCNYTYTWARTHTYVCVYIIYIYIQKAVLIIVSFKQGTLEKFCFFLRGPV